MLSYYSLLVGVMEFCDSIFYVSFPSENKKMSPNVNKLAPPTIKNIFSFFVEKSKNPILIFL